MTRLRDRLAAMQDHVCRLTAELAEAKQRTDGIHHELDAASAKLCLLDDQLDGLP